MSHDTTKLGKPFKFVKSINFVTYDDTGQFHHAKAHLYLDPRGDAGFAIGIPDAIRALLGKNVSDDDYRERATIETDKSGASYVKGLTAASAEKYARYVYNEYKKALDQLNQEEVIQISFDGLVPEYAENGSPTGKHVCNPSRTRFGGSAGTEMTLSLFFQRGFRVGSHFVLMEPDGRMVKSFIDRGQTIIPFTQETWDQLIAIRETVSKAIQALSGVFKADDKDIPGLLLSGFAGSRLLAPPEVSVKRIGRSRRG